MRRFTFLILVLCGLLSACSTQAAGGRVFKVLPMFLDKEGRESTHPSLFERDAYQALLRAKPELRSGLRYAVKWQASGTAGLPLKLRLELRGVAQGELPRTATLDLPVKPTSLFGRWSLIELTGPNYIQFGEVTAWRVTLWEGDKMVSEQKSFLW